MAPRFGERLDRMERRLEAIEKERKSAIRSWISDVADKSINDYILTLGHGPISTHQWGEFRTAPSGAATQDSRTIAGHHRGPPRCRGLNCMGITVDGKSAWAKEHDHMVGAHLLPGLEHLHSAQWPGISIRYVGDGTIVVVTNTGRVRREYRVNRRDNPDVFDFVQALAYQHVFDSKNPGNTIAGCWKWGKGRV